MNVLPEQKSVLSLQNLTGGWGKTVVTEDVSLTVANGETVAIIGRNGVGKSTLFELVTGRARLQQGRILLSGQDLTGKSTYERARCGIGYVPQNREVFPSLTVAEHLDIAARPGHWTRTLVLDLFPSLSRRHDALAGYLSGGEQQMLAIARALIGNPTVLLLDEPSEGLAPIVVESLVLVLRQLVEDASLAILLIEQRIEIALELSDRCLVMDRGRIVHQSQSAVFRGEEANLAELIGLEGD